MRYTEKATEIGVFDGYLIFGNIKYTNENEYKGTLKNNKYHGGPDFSSLESAAFKEFFPDDILKNSAKTYRNEHINDNNYNFFFDN